MKTQTLDEHAELHASACRVLCPVESEPAPPCCPCGCMEEVQRQSTYSRAVERRRAGLSVLWTAAGVLTAAGATFALFALIERWQR